MNSTTMVEFAPRSRTSRTGEPRENANTGECLGYGREIRQAGCQRNRAVESSRLKDVAPRHGFEPRFTAPKAAVLPLDDRGMDDRTSLSVALSVRLLQRFPAHLPPAS